MAIKDVLPQPHSGHTHLTPVRIRRQQTEGMRWVEIGSDSSPIKEIHLTVTPLVGEPVVQLARRLAETLNTCDATVVRQIIFGSVKEQAVTLPALRQALEDPTLPVTWVEGNSCATGALAGIQIHALSGANVRTIFRDENPLGRVWDDAVAQHCVLCGLGANASSMSRSAQTRKCFEELQSALVQTGMTMKDVARTWFFLDDILDWYGDFNAVRNDFFARSELRPGSVPASTGVSGRNPAKSAVGAAAWAMRAHTESFPAFRVVPSPRQCPAPAYGSAFSRAVEIHSAGFRQLLVSGTASIAPDGTTAHVGDLRAQIELSMQVVSDILESRAMSFADVSRATVYFKSPADAPVFAEWLARRGLENWPIVFAGCDICREDLLFEIELDAVQAGAGS